MTDFKEELEKKFIALNDNKYQGNLTPLSLWPIEELVVELFFGVFNGKITVESDKMTRIYKFENNFIENIELIGKTDKDYVT